MSNNDPLSQFRRNQPAAPAQQGRSPAPAENEELEPPRRYDNQGKEIYQAFQVRSRKCDRLEIRQTNGITWQFPRYFDLADMGTDRHDGTEIVLHFPLYTVFVKGRNLQPVVYAIKESRCIYIQDYQPQAFAPISDPHDTAAFIETLMIVVKPKAGAGNIPGEKGNTTN